ncbi:sugar ABC transporter substrate-binding protein [Pseudonocardia lacus]|uniref:sugar ABC transporter substrate-binding protein n=1 Tax=Pseudonocardia lacus TaxID=2835865 RepID=UPI001BDD8798|nr:sugar ABC transporter substrate-binding protein [Pseudonocardia lacus]
MIALLAVSALALGACGEDRVQSSPSEPSAGPVAADAQAAAAAAVEKGYEGTSTLPDPTPRPGAKAKRVIFISSGQNSISTAIPLAGQMEAAQALGWETQLLDGQSNPSLWPGLVRQAIAAQPDAISLQAIDCPLVSQPLEEARAAGIKIAAGYSFDCDDPKFGGQPLFDAVPFFASANGDPGEFTRLYGQLQGETAIAKFGAETNVLQFNDEEFRILDYTNEGFQRAIKAGGGTINYSTFLVSELGPNLEAKVAGELLKHPEVNVVKSPYTGATLLGIASGIQKAGRQGKVFVIGGEGFAPELDLMRQGAVDVVNITPPAWIGWATIDALNSVFIGQEPVDCGIGWTLVDAEHGLPSEVGAAYEKSPDFRSVYKKAWGV